SKALGNTDVGDGKRFKGRGPIQLTGRANYQRFGDLLGVDLVADPTRAANSDVAFRIAGLFWSKNGLNELADLATAEAFTQITKRINGGTNGLADRQAFYAVARKVLGVAEAPISRGGVGAVVLIPADELFQRGAEAIRTHARRPTRRKAKKRALKRKAKARAGKKTAAQTRTRKARRSSKKGS